MSDMTKLAAEVRRAGQLNPGCAPSWEKVERFVAESLERLEKCEADYKRCCELNERLCYEVHDLKAARAAVERLEQCEALIEEQDKLLAAYRTGSNRMAGRAIDRIHELRAALEEK